MADFAKAANDEIRRLRAALREAEEQRDTFGGLYNISQEWWRQAVIALREAEAQQDAEREIREEADKENQWFQREQHRIIQGRVALRAEMEDVRQWAIAVNVVREEAEAQREAIAEQLQWQTEQHETEMSQTLQEREAERGRTAALRAALREILDTAQEAAWEIASRALAGEPRHTDECRFQHGSGKWECRPDCPTLVAEPEREGAER